MSSDPYPDVERELGLLLRRARASAGAVAARVHPDLDPGAYPLLVRIRQVPGIRAAELAAHVGVGKPTISRQLQRLEGLGLVARRPDPQDSRGQLLELTPEGDRRVQETIEARRAWLRGALAAWPEADVEALARALAQLNVALSEAAHPTPR
ncbi:MarR family winged helix-turn-helix transcriptional regulator [Actinotalea subterranea]|uniref:MarR family winged helix-turn-helix transcriptional regulator n=1 Tax=Actinotalea subterranea TaxID=2607497 RepID=UPI0011EF5ADF|nr:MarR family winged helix-turn-helix transcriptional regulator [Actinotalea subterranea]